MPDILARLKLEVDKLHALLADPQPGLITWNEMVGRQWKAIAELWEPAEERTFWPEDRSKNC